MNKTYVRIADWHQDMKDIMRIREAVFINEQEVPPELEWDEADATAIHFLAIDGSYCIGTARLLVGSKQQGRISRVAVLKDWRGLHIGDAILEAVINKAKELGISQLCLTAQTHARRFYERFGFTAVSDEFLEVGIPHIEMCRPL